MQGPTTALPNTQHFLRGCQRGTQLTNRSEESPAASARPEKLVTVTFFLQGKKGAVYTFCPVFTLPLVIQCRVSPNLFLNT